MTVEQGRLVDYGRFRKLCEDVIATPLLWKWSDLEEVVAQRRSGIDRGLVALSRGDNPEGGRLHAELTVAIQTVGSGKETIPHAHTWWHLYVVLSGRGECAIGEHPVWQSLEQHDFLLIPAGHKHCFRGSDGNGLVLVNISNIAEQAFAGTFRQSS